MNALRTSWLAKPWFWLLALVVFRVAFSVALPMTGDESYFVLWGEHPAGGYYDHPPMVGWWLSGLLGISRAEWVLRLPSTLLPLLLAWGGWWLARPYGFERARLAAILILLQPANVWNVLITTDTPAILFSMLSVLAYVAALRRGARPGASLFWHALAGALLGLAFLGKYFAALLGFAYLAHVSLARRDAGRWAGFAALLLAALPAPFYNLWWNSGHCWTNILFNFMNRHGASGVTWTNPALYLASLLYLLTPWLMVALWRERRWLDDALPRDVAGKALLYLALVPLSVFALMSVFRPVGLHWMLSFTPLLAALAAMALPVASLRHVMRWAAGFALVHMLAFSIILALPIQTWQKTKLYDGIVLTMRGDELMTHLSPFADDYLFAMDGYSPAATMSYNANRHFAVFGEGSSYARQDDFVTDWRAWDGRNVLILRKSEPRAGDYSAYFRRVELRTFEVLGAQYWIVLGQGFDYSAYHGKVLARIRDRFYQIPAWLPQRACEFCERYFPEVK